MSLPVVRKARGAVALVAFSFVLALGVVAVSPSPQPMAVVLCIVVGWWFALRRGALVPGGSQVALLGTLLVFLLGAVKAWWLTSTVGLILGILIGIAFIGVTTVASGRAKE